MPDAVGQRLRFVDKSFASQPVGISCRDDGRVADHAGLERHLCVYVVVGFHFLSPRHGDLKQHRQCSQCEDATFHLFLAYGANLCTWADCFCWLETCRLFPLSLSIAPDTPCLNCTDSDRLRTLAHCIAGQVALKEETNPTQASRSSDINLTRAIIRTQVLQHKPRSSPKNAPPGRRRPGGTTLTRRRQSAALHGNPLATLDDVF